MLALERSAVSAAAGVGRADAGRRGSSRVGVVPMSRPTGLHGSLPGGGCVGEPGDALSTGEVGDDEAGSCAHSDSLTMSTWLVGAAA